MKDDIRVIEHISRLVEEERRLREHAASEGGASRVDHERLAAVEERLDQCWDLLRQRRGRRHAGADPGSAKPRDPDTVERYLQ
jgi:hypothetical protein